jgi:hypothetical protein
MKPLTHSQKSITVAAALLCVALCDVSAADGRTILSLDGDWQIEAGEANEKPLTFSSTIPEDTTFSPFLIS